MTDTTIRRLKLAEATQIEGRIDAVEQGKVYGWAWDRLRPDDRLSVEIWLEDRRLGSGIAESPRADLAGNGIGDGCHAYIITLESPLPDGQEPNLIVRATSPSSGSTATAKPRPDVAIGADHKLAGSLGRIASLLETSQAADRQAQAAHHAMLRDLRVLRERPVELPDFSTRIEAPLAAIAGRQTALEAQIATLELFTLRFDAALAAFDTKLARPTPPNTEHRMRRMMYGVGSLAVISLGLAVTALLRLPA